MHVINLKNESIYVTPKEADLLWTLKIKRSSRELSQAVERSVQHVRNTLSNLYSFSLLGKKKFGKEVFYWTPVNVLESVERARKEAAESNPSQRSV